MFIIATRNAHKILEIREILGPQYRCVGLDLFRETPEVVEDAGSFAGNATKKAVEIAKYLSCLPESELKAGGVAREDFVLADDSGLEVDALNGAPGIHSARFAAMDKNKSGNSTDAQNRKKLLQLLDGVPAEKRTARFRCVLALTPALCTARSGSSPVCYADELELQTQIFEGTCEGRIVEQERGAGGFGYDSLFVPNGYEKTFAELSEGIKNGTSHRCLALRKLTEAISSSP